jgi:hypothetical protein
MEQTKYTEPEQTKEEVAFAVECFNRYHERLRRQLAGKYGARSLTKERVLMMTDKELENAFCDGPADQPAGRGSSWFDDDTVELLLTECERRLHADESTVQ